MRKGLRQMPACADRVGTVHSAHVRINALLKPGMTCHLAVMETAAG